jgi:hypothetical protein
MNDCGRRIPSPTEKRLNSPVSLTSNRSHLYRFADDVQPSLLIGLTGVADVTGFILVGQETGEYIQLRGGAVFAPLLLAVRSFAGNFGGASGRKSSAGVVV